MLVNLFPNITVDRKLCIERSDNEKQQYRTYPKILVKHLERTEQIIYK